MWTSVIDQAACWLSYSAHLSWFVYTHFFLEKNEIGELMLCKMLCQVLLIALHLVLFLWLSSVMTYFMKVQKRLKREQIFANSRKDIAVSERKLENLNDLQTETKNECQKDFIDYLVEEDPSNMARFSMDSFDSFGPTRYENMWNYCVGKAQP